MRPGTVVLAHGPLDPPDWWDGAADALRVSGADVVVPRAEPAGPPYAVGWIAGSARPLHAAEVTAPLVLVAHGSAGPLLPALARTQRAAGRQIGGYVFVDATLPRPGRGSHLDLLRAADPAAADALHDALHGHRPDEPTPEPSTRPAGDHAFWTEPLPPAIDWPDAPCGYLSTGVTPPHVGPVDWWARSAAQRGWTVAEADADDGLGDELAALIARLPG